MKVQAISTYYGENGKILEQHSLWAEFDGEFEMTGAEGTAPAGIAGRAMEIETVGRGLLNAIREEQE